MKKNNLLVVLSLAAVALLATGCGNEKANQVENEKIETPIASESTQKSFAKTGIWIGKNEEGIYSDYLCINEDGKSGNITSIETGTGLSFDYTTKENDVVEFKMGSADAEPEIATIVNTDENNITIEWQDGRKEEYTYVQADTEFSFNSNDELCDMALTHFARHNEEESPELAGAVTNEDGTVTIQLYDNIDGHNSTSAYYTVDRKTLKGTNDSTGESIDLNN